MKLPAKRAIPKAVQARRVQEPTLMEDASPSNLIVRYHPSGDTSPSKRI